MKSTTFFYFSLLAITTLSSCAIDKGFVARDWSNNLRELNIQPIFPPREDVQVGDVYLLPYSPNSEKKDSNKKKEFASIGTWINSINLTKELNDHYSQRPDFPKTTHNKDTSTMMERQPTSSGNLFSGGEVNRLKMVLLPTFFKAEVSSFDAASLIPSSALKGLGIAAENIKKAYVTISSASSYGIPVAKLKGTLFEKGQLCINKATGMDLRNLKFTVDKTESANKHTKQAMLIIVTEVFYARTLKVQLSLDKSIAAGNNNQSETSPQETTKSASAGTKNAKNNHLVAEENLARIKQKTLITPGVSVNVGSSAHGSVSVDRTFERPIAIGFRGIRQVIALDSSSGTDACQTTNTSSANAGGDVGTLSSKPGNK